MASPFASLDAEPSRVTSATVVTVCAGPAFATGATFAGVADTVIVTVEAVLTRVASRTTRLNVSVAAVAGDVKVGLDAVVLDSVTVGPAVCVQAYVMASPFGSLEPA